MFKKFNGVKIVATGSYLPSRIVTNDEIIKEYGLHMSGEQMETLLGVKERRAAAENEACSDLITKAAQKILISAGISAEELDLIIVSAIPGDGITPPTASAVQGKLGAKCPAMDVGMACTGWTAGIEIALHYLERDNSEKRILVMAGTILSKGVKWTNPMHRAIFGDAAAGVLLEKCSEKEGQFWCFQLWTRGEHRDEIRHEAPWSILPLHIPSKYTGGFYMIEREVLFQALEGYMKSFLDEFWKHSGFNPNTIDVALIHQPSKPLFLKGVKESGIALEKVLQNLAQYGNVIAAEQPLTLDEGIRKGRIKRGDKVFILTYGAGLTGGTAVFQY